VVILSVGILGLVRLQSVGLGAQHAALASSDATLLGADIVERMRLNRAAAYAGDYDLAATDADPQRGDCSGGSCSASELAADDLSDWRRRVEMLLPGGSRSSVAFGAGWARVELTWPARRGADEVSRLAMRVRL
jgi:type IV pilus assembly protein PilV